MARNSGLSLRPQDILILLKLVSWKDTPWRQLDLGRELDVSQAEIANALERLRGSGLIDESKRKVFRLAATEFLVHAVKYFFPPEIGATVRGVPTAHSAAPLSERLVASESERLVWPDPEGEVRGIALTPIYPSAPSAAKRDSELHELLALTDALRAGRARERKLAEEELTKKLLKAGVKK